MSTAETANMSVKRIADEAAVAAISCPVLKVAVEVRGREEEGGARRLWRER